MRSAAASLGMIMLWDVDTGFTAVDKYSFSTEKEIKAGALMATGMLSSGVSSELDAAYALLAEHVEADAGAGIETQISAIFGLGLAYAGSAREDVLEALVPLIVEDSQPMEVVAITCLALGLVFVGTANDDIAGSIVEAFLDRSDTDLRSSVARQMCLGMGLLFVGKGDAVDGALSAVKVFI
jgi:26S proteasome regulatory subunit N1